MPLPRRKQIRLTEYDYSSPGAYFVTICTQDRRCILSEIPVGALHEAPAATVKENTVGALHEAPAATVKEIPIGALHEAPAAEAKLTKAGSYVRENIEFLPQRYPNLFVDKYVIMPNHIHLLLRIEEEGALREAPLRKAPLRKAPLRKAPLRKAPLRGDGKRSVLSQAVGYLKMNSSKRIHADFPDLVVWQRSYHEHVIRNENDYREIWQYIDENPTKWALDRYYAP